jgi:hypothetical protein
VEGGGRGRIRIIPHFSVLGFSARNLAQSPQSRDLEPPACDLPFISARVVYEGGEPGVGLTACEEIDTSPPFAPFKSIETISIKRPTHDPQSPILVYTQQRGTESDCSN